MFGLSLILVVVLFSCTKPSVDCWKCKTWMDSQHPSDTDPVVNYFCGRTEQQIAKYIEDNTIITMDTIQGKVYQVYHKETRCVLWE